MLYGFLQPGESKILDRPDNIKQPIIASNYAVITNIDDAHVTIENPSEYLAVYSIVYVEAKYAKLANSVDWRNAVTMLSTKNGREEILRRLMIIGMNGGKK